MPCARPQSHFKWVAFLLFLTLVPETEAQISWTNLAGGNWNSADNWSPNGLPTASDSVSINLDGNYTVTLNVAARVESLTSAAGSGSQVFSIPSHKLTLATNSSFGANCQLELGTGTISILDGTLALPVSVMSSNGTLDVAKGAFINATSGNSVAWSGQLNGTGAGQLLLNSGAIDPSPTVTLNFDDGVFQWGGGTFYGGSVTNADAVVIAGTSPAYLNEGNVFFNQGSVKVTGPGGLDFYQSGGGDIFNNLPGGKFEFTTDSSVYGSGCCGGPSDQAFNNQGLVWKSGGTNTTSISVEFNNMAGVIEVDSGTLSLANSGANSDGTLIVAAGATLDLTGGASPSWSGQMTGHGLGQVLLTSGNIVPDPSLTLAFTSSLFHWGGGTFYTGTVTNISAVIINGASPAYLNEGSVFVNQGLVQVDGANGLDFYQSGSGDKFTNMPEATFEFTTDSQIFGSGCCGGPSDQAFYNLGLVWKSGGTNKTTISVPFDNTNGTIEVDSGTLALAGGGASSNGTFIVAGGASLDPTGGSSPSWSGQMTGHGLGQVLFNAGNIYPEPTLTLAFTNGLFQWGGGTFYTGTVTNIGVVIINGADPAYLNEGNLFINRGLVQLSTQAGLDFYQSGGGDIFDNLAGGTFAITTDSQVYGSGCCGGPSDQAFNNQGLVWKNGGTNVTPFLVPFNNADGIVEVTSGTLSLADGGASSNETFIVASGATLDPTGGSSPLWSGQMTGGGSGQILFSAGTINPNPTLTLAFTNNLFQWGGGVFSGGVVTNNGIVIIQGANPAYLNYGDLFVNLGLVQVTGPGGLDFYQSGGGDIFDNMPGATFALTADSQVYASGCCGGPSDQAFNNQGLVWKSGGTNTTTISVPFNNVAGMIEVDDGTLSLANSGTSSNGNFIVASGATLDPTGNNNPRWSGQITGSGSGEVLFSTGNISPNPSLTLAFTNNMLQWAGGVFNGGTVTNTGNVTIGSANPSYLNNGCEFVNQGLVQLTGSGGLDFYQSGAGDVFNNLQKGTFEFTTDSPVYGSGCCGGPAGQAFNNQGLVWKSGGTNTSAISLTFNNQAGALRVDTGTLSLGGNNYAQGGGNLTIGIAGQGAGQHGLLALTGTATLNGPLTLSLAQGYVPPVGSLFQILSSGSLSGTFSSFSLPPSFIVNYSNNSVYATYTGAPTFVVSASNNPLSAGSVANTGVFIAGTINLLTATPSYGYGFASWTKGGTVVGTNAVLTNVVTADESYVATYVATNVTHVVTVTTSPAGAAVSGAGTYDNNRTVTISAPITVTNGQQLDTFQYFTVNNSFAGSNNVIETVFSTTNQPDIQVIAYYTSKPLHPQVVDVTANYGNPVPKTTNFVLQLQFDRTMNTAIPTSIKFTNVAPGAVQPTAGTKGQWSTTIHPSDTYTTPPITFGPGMDGTVQVQAFGAADTNGNKLVLTNILTLQVFSTPPLVTVASPTNGELFTTTNTINFSASASSIYGLTNLTLYNGTNAVGTTAGTNLTVTLSGLTAGSYPLFAVATDANGTSATSLVSHVTVSLPGTTLIDFEALDATAGPVTNAPLIAYLARYGVSFHRSTNTMLAVENESNILGGTVTVASSGVNLLTQIGTNGAVAFTLFFDQPYQSAHWTRTELLAGTSGAISPEWRARAFDSNGVEVGSVGERQKGSFTNIPAAPFTLSGTNITSITFAANNNVGPLNNLALDDLLLSTFPPGANINITLTAADGTNYSAPGQVTLTAAASETGGVINQIDFYEGENLLGSATDTTNATLGLTNVAAGTYTFTAVASDGTYSRSSAPLNVNVAPSAGIAVINFDALDATAGAVGGLALSNYLAGFGVSLANGTLGTRLEVLDENNLSGSAGAIASSPPNLFTQAGLNTAVKFSFVFHAPLGSFGFTRVGLTAGPAGVSHPAWTAYALNATGEVLEQVSEPLIFSFDNVPARTFQLAGNGIARVRFESDSQGTANFSAVLLDDLVLDTNAVAGALSIVLKAAGPFTAGVPVTLTAAVTDDLAGIPTVSFFDGGNLIGSAQGGSDTVLWTNALAGSHILTAQLSDSTGYAVSSPAVRVIVNPSISPLTPVLVNFDSLDANTAPVTGSALAAYLSASGITVTNISAGTKLAVENQSLLNGGGYVIASSPPNVLTQIGSNKTVSFTLSFSPLLAQFAFTRPELAANPFVSEPAWEVRAFDPLGVLLGQRSEGLISSYTNVPAQPFALSGAAIARVEFISHGSGLTTFESLVMDDFILAATTNPPPSVVLTNPTPGQVFTAPPLIFLGAKAVAGKATVTNVNFYYAAANEIGSASANPFLILWSNPPPGSYALTAVASDSSGLIRTSPPVSITVNPASNQFGILTQPVSATVATGTGVIFSVQTTGTNTVTYQWYQNGDALRGQTQPTLSLSGVSSASDGTYTVMATSDGDSIVSAGAVLTVLDPPTIAQAPLSQFVDIGGTATLSVAINGDPPLSYQWLLNGTGIDGATNSSYTISAAQPLNSGDYQVIAVNPVGFSESPIAVVSVTSAGEQTVSPYVFSERASIDPLVGPIFGNNTGANPTPGTGAPQFIAGKPYGRSLWYIWHASFDGVISFTTQGSSFDTLLAVYTGTSLPDLTLVAADDDSGGFFTSLVTFNCVAGMDYQIEVAGFRGASGQVVLGLPAGTGYRVLNPGIGDSVPVITQQPTNQVVPVGAKVKLTVVATSPTPLSYQWFFQNTPIAGASSSTLTLTNFQSGAVGPYYVLVANSIGSTPSSVANLQIAAQSSGKSSSADDKFGDAIDLNQASGSSTTHGGPIQTAAPRNGGGDTGGFSVSQTFTTAGATKEPGEPNPCGQTGGASEWYVYTTPAAGTFHIDTFGSDFNTLVGIYTNSGTSSPTFATLVEVGCGYTTNFETAGQPFINLPDVPADTEFLIVVDGYQGASGVVQLNIGLGAPPAILNQPKSRPAVPGDTAAFAVMAVGTTNLFYQWQFNGASIAGASGSSFTVSNAQPLSIGNYSVVVSNIINVVTSVPAALTLQSSPFIFDQPASQTVNVGHAAGFSVSAGGVTPLSYQWFVGGAPIANASSSTLTVAATKFASEGNYTVVVNNSLGGVTSAPAFLTVSETTKPTLVVTYPPGNITTNNPTITVRGTANDALDVTSVQLVINNNIPQTAIGTTNWSAVVPLQVGANSVTVQSYNPSGLVSVPITRSIFYTVTSPLTLQTNGLGRITGEANQAQLQVNKNYTIMATPAPNFLFSNWTGSNFLAVGTNHILSFAMATNLLLQANFVTNPFRAVAGNYNGLFYPTNGILTEENSGFFSLNLSPIIGAYTGNISQGGRHYGFTGAFDLSGNSQAGFIGPNRESVDVILHVNLNLNPPDNQMTGTLSTADWQSALMADRAVFNGTTLKATNYAAHYTMVVPPGRGAPEGSPGGYGVATIVNNEAGMASLVGNLGDGTSINQFVPMSENGVIPVYVSLYNGQGLLLGWLTFTNVPPQTLSGVLNWINLTGASKTLYPGGFTNQTPITGSVYQQPGGLFLSNGMLTISAAAQVSNLVYTNVTVSGAKLSYSAADNPTNQLSATINATTGTMTLTFRPTGAKADITARGVVLQSESNAAGWYLGTNQSGYFLLQP